VAASSSYDAACVQGQRSVREREAESCGMALNQKTGEEAECHAASRQTLTGAGIGYRGVVSLSASCAMSRFPSSGAGKLSRRPGLRDGWVRWQWREDEAYEAGAPCATPFAPGCSVS